MAVHEEAGLLHLGDDATLTEQVGEKVVAHDHGSARSLRRRHQAVAPVGRLAVSKEDGRVDDLAEGLLHPGLHLAPDVVVSVVQDRLGNGHDDRDLLGVNDLLVPCLLGGLLRAGVTVHKVGDRQGVQDGELVLGGGHVCQTTTDREDSRLLNGPLDDLFGPVLGDQSLRARAVDDLGVGVKKLKIEKSLFHSFTSIKC